MSSVTGSFIVGQSSEAVSLNTPAEVNHIIRELFFQAQQRLNVRATRLEFAFFQSDDLLQSMTTLVSSNTRNQVLFLIDDELHFKSLTRIIHLARTFSSYIKVRKLAEEQTSDGDFFVIADRVAYVHQMSSHNYPVIAEAYAPAKAKELALKFENDWERSEQIMELSTLGL
ncbi:MAG: hypothetical protein QNI91_02740 [Arenicellales bacterium]|nr:hypothetical protein [Arenicellales bacterium]